MIVVSKKKQYLKKMFDKILKKSKTKEKKNRRKEFICEIKL